MYNVVNLLLRKVNRISGKQELNYAIAGQKMHSGAQVGNNLPDSRRHLLPQKYFITSKVELFHL